MEDYSKLHWLTSAQGPGFTYQYPGPGRDRRAGSGLVAGCSCRRPGSRRRGGCRCHCCAGGPRQQGLASGIEATPAGLVLVALLADAVGEVVQGCGWTADRGEVYSEAPGEGLTDLGRLLPHRRHRPMSTSASRPGRDLHQHQHALVRRGQAGLRPAPAPLTEHQRKYVITIISAGAAHGCQGQVPRQVPSRCATTGDPFVRY
jgi:hypothetical protein